MNIKVKWISYIVVCLLLLLFIGTWFLKYEAKQQVSNEEQGLTKEEQVKHATDSLVVDSDFMGTALIVQNGQIAYEKGYGEADKQRKIDNQTETVFPIASLQKSMTAALILQLVKEQKLQLDDSLEQFYPEVAGSESITIQQLLDHTSGISMDEETPAEILTSQERQINFTLDTLIVDPTDEFQYTNANYTLLAGIISKLRNEPYEMVVEQELITPLALKHTYFWDTLPADLSVPLAYVGADDQENTAIVPSAALYSSLLGAGNMFMSVGDFWTFIQSLSNGKLFQKEEYNQLAGVAEGGYRAGIIYWENLFYSVGVLNDFNTVIYGDDSNQTVILLFANQPPTDGIQELSQELYEVWAD